MNKIQVQDKYPVLVEEIAKSETDCANAEEAVARLRARIEAHPGASFIADFDHLAHVRAQPNHSIAEGIRASRHLIFCMSNAMPNALIVAVRPRAVSVVELEDRFVISWLEAPMEGPSQAIAGWVEGLRKA